MPGFSGRFGLGDEDNMDDFSPVRHSKSRYNNWTQQRTSRSRSPPANRAHKMTGLGSRLEKMSSSQSWSEFVSSSRDSSHDGDVKSVWLDLVRLLEKSHSKRQKKILMLQRHLKTVRNTLVGILNKRSTATSRRFVNETLPLKQTVDAVKQSIALTAESLTSAIATTRAQADSTVSRLVALATKYESAEQEDLSSLESHIERLNKSLTDSQASVRKLRTGGPNKTKLLKALMTKM
eukprot:c54346_g1_i1.p2 GENE.c54346_g1_i1~~c54346_g1_i1.p2  ORF type:complete len:235 (+),score=37.23 c54346_g1_i1:1576-2280(+)